MGILAVAAEISSTAPTALALCDTSQMNMQIRELSADDEARWKELFCAYLAFYETSRSNHELDQVWLQLTGEPPRILSVVASIDALVVGLVHFHFQRSTWASVANCYLEDLYVDKAWRSRGIATLLIRAVEQRAREYGCSELHWITASDNAVARHLYDQLACQSTFVRYEIDLEKTD